VPCIAGGFHATFCTQEVKQHFDVVVKGEGIPLIKDAIDLALKREQDILDGGLNSNEKLTVVPDRSFINGNEYSSPNSMLTSFGCLYMCDFCTAWIMNGGEMCFKSKETVEREVKGFVPGKLVFMPDDNMSFIRHYVFDILRDHKFKFVGEADIDFLKTKNYQLAVKSGLVALALGFESLDDNVLYSINKRNRKQSTNGYKEIIRKCKDDGLIVYGFFLIDPDNQTLDDVKKTVDWAIEHDLDFVQFPILTPYPGTVLRKNVADRLVSNDWDKYNTVNALYRGKMMGPDETEEACEYAHKTFYSYSSAFRRLLHTKNVPLFIVGNYGAIRTSRKIWK
jgi:radical SAM superfamily enzyme YgiQ (UPF0313 family)